MKKIFIAIILISTVLLNAKTWEREYTYNASEADSKLTSRAISLEQVKRLLLQEIGVYVHSTILNEEVEVSGELKELTAKQIEIISAGITETKIIEENWNGETYYIKAEITADENDVIKRLDNVIIDTEKTKQLEDSRKKTEKALTKIERLKQQLTQTQDDNEKLILQNEYNQSSNELTAEDWFQKGMNAVDIEEYNNAILYYQKSIELYPYAEAYNNMGITYYNKGNYDKAIECYQKAIDIDSEYAEIYFIMGVAYRDKGDYDKEIECYRKAIERNPDLADAYYSIGIAYHRDDNYVKAIEYYQEAIKNNPDHAKAHYGMGGIAYYHEGNYEKAIEYYQKAIEINPEYAEAYRNMGTIYRNKSINDEAIEYYLKAIEINPDDEDTYLKLGVTYYNKGNVDKAINCFQKAIEINPNYADAYFNIGYAYYNKGINDKATGYFKKAARLGNRQGQEILIDMDISW